MVFNASREMWRHHPAIDAAGNMRAALPGLKIGVGAFAVACTLEFVWNFVSPPRHEVHPVLIEEAKIRGWDH